VSDRNQLSKLLQQPRRMPKTHVKAAAHRQLPVATCRDNQLVCSQHEQLWDETKADGIQRTPAAVRQSSFNSSTHLGLSPSSEVSPGWCSRLVLHHPRVLQEVRE
jgi:tRNA U34 2-thiouridine synthase MnmA/TrmU